MADGDPGDPLAPPTWPGQWWGLSDPYGGLDPQTDPLIEYGNWWGVQPQTSDPFANLDPNVMTAPSDFRANLDPTLQGNVEQRVDQITDPLQLYGSDWGNLLSSLSAQSQSLAPQYPNVPTSPPWAGAEMQGSALQNEAGFGDIGGF